jgi:RNA polymerase sigma factor (sigma-70 family)
MARRRSGDLFKHLSSLFRDGTLAGVPDAQLLDRFVAGRDEPGEAAFRALVERHGPMVLRVCQNVLGDRHDAEDAFQVTFLVLARKAGSIRKQHSLGSWLHGTAHRVALRAQTAARRRLARESKVAKGTEMAAPSAEPGEDQRDLAAALHHEITRLPEKYQAPIVLCYLQGMTHDQAASELGWPVGTVRGRLARARELLGTRLTRRGLSLSAGLVAAGSLSETASAALPSTLVDVTVQAALGSAAAGVLTRNAALLLQAVLRNMPVARSVRLAAHLLLMALVAGGAAMFAYSGGKKLSGERTTVVKINRVPPSAPTDLAGDPLPAGALARLGTTRFLHAAGPTQIAYAPDGATLASFDGALNLWDPLTGRERRRIETGAGNGIGHVHFAYSPDGRSLAVKALEIGDKIVPGDRHNVSDWTDLWDPTSGRKIRRFEGNGMADGLAFSPDGQVLAGAGHLDEKPVITLWDVASGRLIRRIVPPPNALTRPLAFLPGGKFLFACVSWQDNRPGRADESAIYLWDVATGAEIRRIGMGKARTIEAILAPDGKTVATSASDKTVRLWDLRSGREIRRFGEGANVETRHLAFSPDGTKLASTEANWMDPAYFGEGPLTMPIHIWDTATGRELRHWEMDNGSRVCFSPDGTTLASVSRQVIRLWEVATGREIRPRTGGHHAEIGDAAFTPDGRSIVTVGHDRDIRFWDPDTGREIRQLERSDASLDFVAFSADGKTMATGHGSQPTRLWDVASGRELRRLTLPGKSDDQFVSCADLSPDGKTLATSAGDGVILWDTATGQWRAGVAKSPLATRITKLVKALRFAPDGESVVTIGGHWIRIWNVATARETRRIVMPTAPPWRPGGPPRPQIEVVGTGAALAFSPDGKVLAASSQQDGRICLLDMTSGQEIARLDGPSGKKALAFSPDGKILATVIETSDKLGRGLAIRLWDVTARRDLCRVKAHRSGISALAFSPDGRRLLSASADATALVWDVAALIGQKTTPAADRRGEGVRRE